MNRVFATVCAALVAPALSLPAIAPAEADAATTSTASAASTTEVVVADPAGDYYTDGDHPDNGSIDLSEVRYSFLAQHTFARTGRTEPAVRVVIDFAEGFTGEKGNLQRSATQFVLNDHWHTLDLSRDEIQLMKAKRPGRRGVYAEVHLKVYEKWYSTDGQLGAVIPISALGYSPFIDHLTTSLQLTTSSWALQAMDDTAPHEQVLDTHYTRYEHTQRYWTKWQRSGKTRCQSHAPSPTKSATSETKWRSRTSCTVTINGRKVTRKLFEHRARVHVDQTLWLAEGQECLKPRNVGADYSCEPTGRTS